MTPGTDELLDLLRHADPYARSVPAPVLIVAAQTRAAGREGRRPEPLHVPTAAGWVTLARVGADRAPGTAWPS